MGDTVKERMPIQSLQQALSINRKTQTLGHDLLMRSIKMVDIGYLIVIYVFLAIICSKITDFIFGKFQEEEEKKKSFLTLSIELIFSLWLYGILIYFIRNLVPLIPFPLDGFQGFEHHRVKEVGNATVFTFIFLLYSNLLRNKILYYYKRLPKVSREKNQGKDENDVDIGGNMKIY